MGLLRTSPIVELGKHFRRYGDARFVAVDEVASFESFFGRKAVPHSSGPAVRPNK
jgi:hypothetical protein